MDLKFLLVLIVFNVQESLFMYINDHVDRPLERSARCTKPECDSTGALSYCGDVSKSCNSGHEQAPNSVCNQPGKMCCRTACSGPLSYCFALDRECLQGHVTVQGKCPVDGYKCCAPMR